MKPKTVPHLHQILYNGVKEYICKYGHPNDSDVDNTNNNRTTNFERVQFKFYDTDDIEEVRSKKKKREINDIA